MRHSLEQEGNLVVFYILLTVIEGSDGGINISFSTPSLQGNVEGSCLTKNSDNRTDCHASN